MDHIKIGTLHILHLLIQKSWKVVIIDIFQHGRIAFLPFKIHFLSKARKVSKPDYLCEGLK